MTLKTIDRLEALACFAFGVFLCAAVFTAIEHGDEARVWLRTIGKVIVDCY